MEVLPLKKKNFFKEAVVEARAQLASGKRVQKVNGDATESADSHSKASITSRSSC